MFGREFTGKGHQQHVLPPNPTSYSFEKVGSTKKALGLSGLSVGDEVYWYDGGDDVDTSVSGVIVEFPAVDPDGRVHSDIAAVEWSDQGYDLVEINSLLNAEHYNIGQGYSQALGSRKEAARTAGTEKVRGQAQVGDLVTYYDIANQSGDVWVVVGDEETESYTPSGISLPGRGYELRHFKDGTPHWSDLRQPGWTFATDFDLSRNSSRTASGWVLDQIADAAGMVTPIGNGWEILSTQSGPILHKGWGDYDSASVTPPESEMGGEWRYSVHARLYQVFIGSGSANSAEEAMAACEELYDEYKRTASCKTAAVTWHDQSDQFGGMWSTYQGSAPDSPNGQISESGGMYRWYVSDSGTRGNQQTGESYSLEEAKREAESALASLGVTASTKTAGLSFTEWMSTAYPGKELLDFKRPEQSKVLNEYIQEVGEGNEIWSSRTASWDQEYDGTWFGSFPNGVLGWLTPSRDSEFPDTYTVSAEVDRPGDSRELFTEFNVSLEEGKRMVEEAAAQFTSSRTADHHLAFFDTFDLPEPRHRVAGWDWDDHLNGFLAAEAVREFTCSCGENIPAPGYTDCRCGKRWNAYTIQANGSKKMIAREIPVRENVVMAGRTASRRQADNFGEDWLYVDFLDWAQRVKGQAPTRELLYEYLDSGEVNVDKSGDAFEYAISRLSSRKQAAEPSVETPYGTLVLDSPVIMLDDEDMEDVGTMDLSNPQAILESYADYLDQAPPVTFPEFYRGASRKTASDASYEGWTARIIYDEDDFEYAETTTPSGERADSIYPMDGSHFEGGELREALEELAREWGDDAYSGTYQYNSHRHSASHNLADVQADPSIVQEYDFVFTPSGRHLIEKVEPVDSQGIMRLHTSAGDVLMVRSRVVG